MREKQKRESQDLSRTLFIQPSPQPIYLTHLLKLAAQIDRIGATLVELPGLGRKAADRILHGHVTPSPWGSILTDVLLCTDRIERKIIYVTTSLPRLLLAHGSTLYCTEGGSVLTHEDASSIFVRFLKLYRGIFQ